MKAEHPPPQPLLPTWPGVSSRSARSSAVRGAQHLGDRRFETLMRIGGDPLDATQAAPGELAEEGGPEGLGSEKPISMPSSSRRPWLLTTKRRSRQPRRCDRPRGPKWPFSLNGADYWSGPYRLRCDLTGAGEHLARDLPRRREAEPTCVRSPPRPCSACARSSVRSPCNQAGTRAPTLLCFFIAFVVFLSHRKIGHLALLRGRSLPSGRLFHDVDRVGRFLILPPARARLLRHQPVNLPDSAFLQLLGDVLRLDAVPDEEFEHP